MIAGGTESMSMVPMTGNKPSFNARIFESDENVGIAYGMGLTAEKVAEQWKVTREMQDEFAYASHQKAIAAQKAGLFADEMTTIDILEKFPHLGTRDLDVRTRSVSLDEGPRADTNLEALAKLRPVFAAKGSVTAGNSSQTSDGAGALILASERAVKQFNLTPLVRFVSFCDSRRSAGNHGHRSEGGDTRRVKLAGISKEDVGWIELNEAFAAQAVAVINDLGSRHEQSQSDGRRDCSWSPARGDWCDPLCYRRACDASKQPQIRNGHDVRRNRNGRRWNL